MEKKTDTEKIEAIVNNMSFNTLETGVKLTRIHRYLVNELFKMFVHFAGQLARRYDNGTYDGRDSYACECSRIIIDALKEKEKYDEKWFNQLYDEILQKSND